MLVAAFVLNLGVWFLNGQVIPAFEEAVSGMSPGGIRRCCICLLLMARVIFIEIDYDLPAFYI